MLSNRVIEAMGLLHLQARTFTSHQNIADPVNTVESDLNQQNTGSPSEAVSEYSMAAVKLDKNQFRLLVKMLQAIGHECTYDHIGFDGKTVTYQHPNKTLVFNDIAVADTQQIMNLSSLKELLLKPELKRAVWEKLKTLNE